jgi:protein AroM
MFLHERLGVPRTSRVFYPAEWLATEDGLALHEVVVPMSGGIGILTIGQTPRPDVKTEFQRHSRGSEILVTGALDGLSPKEIAEMSKNDSEYPLQTRLADGTIVEVPAEELAPLFPSAAAKLTARGAAVVVLGCAGDFPLFECTAPLLLPGRAVPALMRAVSRTMRIGIVTPTHRQNGPARRKWERDGFSVRVASASPFREEEIENAAAELDDRSLEFLVLDCMGHGPGYRLQFSKLSGRPVVAAQTLIARLAAEIVEGSTAA